MFREDGNVTELLQVERRTMPGVMVMCARKEGFISGMGEDTGSTETARDIHSV